MAFSYAYNGGVCLGFWSYVWVSSCQLLALELTLIIPVPIMNSTLFCG